MKRNYTSIFVVLFTFGILCWMQFTLMPWQSKNEGPLADFSEKRAAKHIKAISAEPHYVGSPGHESVAGYLQRELQKLGFETIVQEGTTLSDWGNLVKSKNILARLKGRGSSKALLLLSHYDSAPHSASYGAADNATGVGVILEGIRAFLHNKTPHQNDIIILFSDAEELGLNGAALFVSQSEWASEVGLVLNFEARGTAGPSYMLMEVNNGNSAMVKGFAQANPRYPVSNSLMYSIYKMLPNDTDLTVFREYGKVPGFNFAFIDDHFNYHTAQDDFGHLDLKSVAHQGSYLMPLLEHFGNEDLRTLDSATEHVYFNTPVRFFHYPFGWNLALLSGAFLFFLLLLFIGVAKRLLNPHEMGRGFLRLVGAIAAAGIVAFLGWKILLAAYPRYGDILHGFTYNGHSYIAAFVLLSIAFSFLFYANSKTDTALINYSVAPIALWLIINTLIVFLLPGAGFLIIPVYFTLIMFAYFVATQRTNKAVFALLSIPSLLIYVPFIVMLPIGLGLKILVASAVLTVLVFGLLLPVFGAFGRKTIWSAVFFMAAIGFFIHAHVNSGFEPGKARPNSLLYVYDSDADKALWTTYDKRLDIWTKTFLTDNPNDASSLRKYQLFSKYNSAFTFTSDALVRDLPEPSIIFRRDSVIGSQRYLDILITPNRNVNRYDIFADESMALHNVKANGAKPLGQQGSLYKRNGRKIISYYVVNNEPLSLQFSIPAASELDMELMESSFDLMTNPLFEMQRRTESMMPMPFVLTDAVVIIKKIQPAAKTLVPVAVRKNFSLQNSAEPDTIPDPDFNTPETY